MVEPNDKKISFRTSIGEAAATLRLLANELEANAVTLNSFHFTFDPEGTIKFNFEKKDDSFSIKMKIRKITVEPEETTNPALRALNRSAGDSIKYKQLKKRMEKAFKRVRKLIQVGELPENELVAGFILDAKKMCTYPDKGEPLYPEFLKAVDAFQEAFSRSDIQAMNDSIENLGRLKQIGHEQYK